jgi:hypothetical protein
MSCSRPTFTSAIAAFGIVFSTYAIIVLSEIWFVYRVYFVEQTKALKDSRASPTTSKESPTPVDPGRLRQSEEAVAKDKKAVTDPGRRRYPGGLLPARLRRFHLRFGQGQCPVDVPLMPVIFIMSAVVSGIALCMLTYIIIMEWKKFQAILAKGRGDESVSLLAARRWT